MIPILKTNNKKEDKIGNRLREELVRSWKEELGMSDEDIHNLLVVAPNKVLGRDVIAGRTQRASKWTFSDMDGTIRFPNIAYSPSTKPNAITDRKSSVLIAFKQEWIVKTKPIFEELRSKFLVPAED